MEVESCCTKQENTAETSFVKLTEMSFFARCSCRWSSSTLAFVFPASLHPGLRVRQLVVRLLCPNRAPQAENTLESKRARRQEGCARTASEPAVVCAPVLVGARNRRQEELRQHSLSLAQPRFGVWQPCSVCLPRSHGHPNFDANIDTSAPTRTRAERAITHKSHNS